MRYSTHVYSNGIISGSDGCSFFHVTVHILKYKRERYYSCGLPRQSLDNGQGPVLRLPAGRCLPLHLQYLAATCVHFAFDYCILSHDWAGHYNCLSVRSCACGVLLLLAWRSADTMLETCPSVVFATHSRHRCVCVCGVVSFFLRGL